MEKSLSEILSHNGNAHIPKEAIRQLIEYNDESLIWKWYGEHKHIVWERLEKIREVRKKNQ